MRELITVTVFSRCPPKLLPLGLPRVWRSEHVFDIYHEKEAREFMQDQLAQPNTINVVLA